MEFPQLSGNGISILGDHGGGIILSTTLSKTKKESAISTFKLDKKQHVCMPKQLI